MAFNNTVNHCKAQTGPFAKILGGKERVKDFRQDILVNTFTLVGNGEPDIVPRFGFRVLPSECLVNVDLFALDQDLTPIGHGITGIDTEVHDNLFQLGGIT